ncbi:DUF4129 domain-containing protein [Infirmifilum lucidum]|uniref:DUF4129 domain-containing protein n=1 Tax=Infirmifilum lucidum TaxID=2776706 RepID=A0A7L9FHE8_9CREN|nr:DUF4129 domain-containing protein [Infirmifilum lucidum]QOJ78423.1 DUF4129 domain-containing protein [Infirmifilum lucidum]
MKEVLLVATLTAMVLAASYHEPREVYLPSVSEQDAFSLIFTGFVLFFALTTFIARHEIAGVLRELFQGGRGRAKARKTDFVYSLIFNLVILLAVFLLFRRGVRDQEASVTQYQVLQPNSSTVPTYSSTGGYFNTTLSSAPTSVNSLVYPYVQWIVLALIAFALTSVALALVHNPKRPQDTASETREALTHALAESRRALKMTRSSAEVRRAIVELYNSFCQALRRKHVEASAEMTAREIMHLSINLIPGIPQKPLEDLTYLFEKALYSNHPMGQEDRNRAEKALTELIDFLGAV